MISGDIVFSLSAKSGNYEMSRRYNELILEHESPLETAFKTVQKSLFETVLARDFNNLERDFAFYLDSRDAIAWWHRVAANQRSGYYVRGWRRNRVFPDFVALATEMGDPSEYRQQILLYETKGTHLQDNEDSRYKEQVLSLLQRAYNGRLKASGCMTIDEGELKGRFAMVVDGRFPEALEGTFAARG